MVHEQFVQSFVKFIELAILMKKRSRLLRQAGAIKIKFRRMANQADVEILSRKELNQMQTQTLVDYMYQVVLAIAGCPYD